MSDAKTSFWQDGVSSFFSSSSVFVVFLSLPQLRLETMMMFQTWSIWSTLSCCRIRSTCRRKSSSSIADMCKTITILILTAHSDCRKSTWHYANNTSPVYFPLRNTVCCFRFCISWYKSHSVPTTWICIHFGNLFFFLLYWFIHKGCLFMS